MIEKAIQTSIDTPPPGEVAGKAESVEEELNPADTFRSKLFAIILGGCLSMLAIFGLALIWALKSPSSKDDSSNADDANSHSDSESVSSADDHPSSPISILPLLHPPLPESSFHSPLPGLLLSLPPSAQDSVTQWRDLLKEDSNNIILGLRVYTQTKDPAKIVHRLGKALD
jgi:hypothetical protein